MSRLSPDVFDGGKSSQSEDSGETWTLGSALGPLVVVLSSCLEVDSSDSLLDFLAPLSSLSSLFLFFDFLPSTDSWLLFFFFSFFLFLWCWFSLVLLASLSSSSTVVSLLVEAAGSDESLILSLSGLKSEKFKV